MSDEIWQKQFEIFELQDEIDDLKKKNKSLDKKNKHFQSTKAYKVWQKYANLKSSPKSVGVKNLKDINVAFIADEFTYNSFKHEFNAINITPKNWRKMFEKQKPDIFFCESAWLGYDESGRPEPWRGKICTKYTQENNLKVLSAILEYCKSNSIPTVFWNKEDPPHYRTEEYSFADTASKFDYIFTSTDKCVKRYEDDFGHPNVYTLMFAGQPKLFNPLRMSDERIDRIVFAGSYYTNHPERSKLMDFIFDKIIDQWGDMLIYDRVYYLDWTGFPERYAKYTVPPIDYEQTAELYKKMDWGLNFNTITDSHTMFARRVFELSLSYVNILTNYSVGVDEIFHDNVFVFDEIEDLPDFNNPYTEKRLNNLYNVLENHTYTKRWMQILDTIGFEYKVDKNDVTLIFKVSDADDIKSVIDKFESIEYENKVLHILLEDKDIDDGFKKQYPQIKKVYRNLKQVRKGIKTEFWMICDTNIDDDFIRHAVLHYQYIHKRVSIKAGDDKFRLTVEDDFENKLISRKNVSYLSDDELEIYTYTI